MTSYDTLRLLIVISLVGFYWSIKDMKMQHLSGHIKQQLETKE